VKYKMTTKDKHLIRKYLINKGYVERDILQIKKSFNFNVSWISLTWYVYISNKDGYVYRYYNFNNIIENGI